MGFGAGALTSAFFSSVFGAAARAARLTAAGMTLLCAHPDHPVTILADGRRLWRVFDNLMNNILKYGQSGTRVYLTLEEINRFAVITFRNVSRDPLNVSPDELMERFVRGDASRSSATEGNGLGLSIAKSLTELQGGALTLAIDGDLFKATLHFPVAGSDPLPAAHPTPTLASGTHPPVLEACKIGTRLDRRPITGRRRSFCVKTLHFSHIKTRRMS